MPSGGPTSTDLRQAQLTMIQSEIESAPLLSDPVERLTESCQLVRELSGNASQLPKALSLFSGPTDRPRYGGIRYARRDGNCFFRCAAFSLFEEMLSRHPLANAFLRQVEEMRPALLSHYGDFVNDFCDVAADMAKAIASGKWTNAAQLHAAATSREAEYALYFFRYAVSQFIRSHRDDFLPFVMGFNYETVEAFCSAEIDAVASESDHVQIVGFARCFRVCVLVEYLDSGEGTETTQHTFAAENPHDGVVITLLFRPGHYDLLYK